MTVDAGGDGKVVVQEIGHLCDLWEHSSDPNNIMTDVGGGTHDQITPWQCCMIRTSRCAFARCESRRRDIEPATIASPPCREENQRDHMP